jgi:hypothetical protein
MNNQANQQHRRTLRAVSLAAALVVSSVATQAGTLDRLQGLLANTANGGWVKVNTGAFSSAWLASSDPAATPATPGGPNAVVTAWSSFAWDSTRNDLLLYGGGHANYAGNEMYTWSADTGTWARGSLPSAVTTPNAAGTSFIVDNAAPQSAHTYDNNVYLPINDKFLTFGGGTYNSSNLYQTNINGTVSYAGPWMWDPTKADPNKVGGTNGSGFAGASSVGGNMWTNRFQTNSVLYQRTNTFMNGATASTIENGKDVVYVSTDPQSGGHAELFRYVVNANTGQADSVTWIGNSNYAYSQEATATLDTKHNLFVRTASEFTAPTDPNYHLTADLAVWNVATATAGAASGRIQSDTPVQLVYANGASFAFSAGEAIEYDSGTDTFYIYDGKSKGVVWTTQAKFNADGSIATTWTVVQHGSTTAAMPNGQYQTSVLGKFKYVAALDAFVVLDEYNTATGDASVWLYKPTVSAVPEAGSLLMMLLGLGGVAAATRRRKA